MKKILVIFFLTLLGVGFVSADLLGFFKEIPNMITGRLTSDTTSVNVTVGNSAPIVNFVFPVGSQSVTESGTTAVEISFNASDADGVSNLNDASAEASLYLSGEELRTNSTCDLVGDDGVLTATYNCTVELWYWDGAGTWTVHANITDINSAKGANDTVQFSVSDTTAMVMGPKSLAWTSLSPTSANQLSSSNPIKVNNTANKDITSGNVQVTGVSLRGETTTSEYLLAANFSVNTANACEGTVLVNGTATGITGTTITAGNNTAGLGGEDIYFCVEEVTSGISSQSYSTESSGAWTVGVV